MTAWQADIPDVNGTLPGGKELRRTDPSGACVAKIAFLGVYPAATEVKQISVAGGRLNLPTEVEHESFAPGSASGHEFEKHYLAALGLQRRDVMATDMLPYYLANTTRSRESGRSMADNVRTFEQATGTITGILDRPRPAALVKLASAFPGNEERLRHFFSKHAPKLLFTLGTESAAFVRSMTFDDARAAGDALFYANPVKQTFAGLELHIVHLVHPHMFIKQIAKWTARHEAWCSTAGRELVAQTIRAR